MLQSWELVQNFAEASEDAVPVGSGCIAEVPVSSAVSDNDVAGSVVEDGCVGFELDSAQTSAAGTNRADPVIVAGAGSPHAEDC